MVLAWGGGGGGGGGRKYANNKAVNQGKSPSVAPSISGSMANDMQEDEEEFASVDAMLGPILARGGGGEPGEGGECRCGDGCWRRVVPRPAV